MSSAQPRPFIHSAPRRPDWMHGRFTPAQLEIKCLRGLIEDYRTREQQVISNMDARHKMHPLSHENSRNNKRAKNAMWQLKHTIRFLENYLAILEGRSDL
jgi:hypothetical protein